MLEGCAEQPRGGRRQRGQWQRLPPAACQERAAPHSGSARRERRQPPLPRKAHELMHVSAEERGCAGASREGRECAGLCFCPPFQRAAFNPGEDMNAEFVK